MQNQSWNLIQNTRLDPWYQSLERGPVIFNGGGKPSTNTQLIDFLKS